MVRSSTVILRTGPVRVAMLAHSKHLAGCFALYRIVAQKPPRRWSMSSTHRMRWQLPCVTVQTQTCCFVSRRVEVVVHPSVQQLWPHVVSSLSCEGVVLSFIRG